jgi:RimJ/RimL family protein N-acetyltransferase
LGPIRYGTLRSDVFGIAYVMNHAASYTIASIGIADLLAYRWLGSEGGRWLLFEPWWQTQGIYADDVMVGFVMYGTWPTSGLPAYYPEMPVGQDFILRFMVDGRYQGKGYGRAALEQVIANIRQRPGAHTIHLSYEPDNKGAAALYAALGFRPTGQMHGSEIEVSLAL